MYKIDNIVLIVNDSIQAILSVILLTITILFEKKINNSLIISQVDINQYIIVGWIAVSFVSLFAILNVIYQLYNLKRVFDFIFKDIHKKQFPQNNNESPDQSILRQTPLQEQIYGIENIQDSVIQQADSKYLEYLKNQKIQKQLDDERKKYFENVTLYNKRQSLTPDQMQYIKAYNQNLYLQNFELNPGKQQINSKANMQVDIKNQGRNSQPDINQMQYLESDIKQYEVRQNNQPQYQIELMTNYNEHQNQSKNINQDFIVNPFLKNMPINQEESPKDQFQSLENQELEDYNYEPIFSQNSVQNYKIPLINNSEQQYYQQKQNVQQQIKQNHGKEANNQSQNIQEDIQQLNQQNQNQQQQIKIEQIQQIQQVQVNHDKIIQKEDQKSTQNLPQKDQNEIFSDQVQIQDRVTSQINDSQNNENKKNNNCNYQDESQSSNNYLAQQQHLSPNQLEVIQENFNEQDSNYYSPDLINQRISEYKKPKI